MKSFKEFFEDNNHDDDEWSYAETLTVTFLNKPSHSTSRLLLEGQLITLEEGKWVTHKDGYSYRLDRRPSNQGGDQLHIKRKGEAWAYRHTGDKSEPSKYKLRPTNAVKDIVSQVFGLDRSVIKECLIERNEQGDVLVEVCFG